MPSLAIDRAGLRQPAVRQLLREALLLGLRIDVAPANLQDLLALDPFVAPSPDPARLVALWSRMWATRSSS